MRILPSHPVVPTVDRVALLSVHTSPLAQPGAGDGGGLNVYVLQVASGLAARGVEVDVFTRASAPSAPTTVTVADRLRVHHLDAGPRGPVRKEDLPRHLVAFESALLAHPTAGSHDVVHAHYWQSGVVGRRVAERWEVPLVQTFHTLGAVKNEALAPGEALEPAERLEHERRLAQTADQIAALTCGEARLLHDRFGVSGARITVVPAGVDIRAFRPDPTPLPASPALPDLPAGEGPLLLFVGRLQPLKGPDVAIRTLAAVRARRPDARLLIVGGTSGNGEGRTGPAELLDLAARLGVADAVRVVPPRPHTVLPHLYRAADVVLAPSRSESFGLVPLEAQACGTPVVATAVGGLNYVVRDGGTLVRGHDPADHAAAALRYLDGPDLAARASAAGRKLAVGLSWERTLDGLLRVYDRTTVAGVRRRAVS